jgi:hypothetical protein
MDKPQSYPTRRIFFVFRCTCFLLGYFEYHVANSYNVYFAVRISSIDGRVDAGDVRGPAYVAACRVSRVRVRAAGGHGTAGSWWQLIAPKGPRAKGVGSAKWEVRFRA